MNNPKVVYGFVIALALLVGYVGYFGYDPLVGGVAATRATTAARRDSIAQFQGRIDNAKRVLARGSIEDLRRQLEGYRTSLDLLRRLVPESNEVPNLLDAITTRAKIRGVEVASFSPGAVAAGPAPFTTHRWTLRVYGHYDQVGEFLSDIASLERIVVPVELQLGIAPAATAATYGDSTGSMLQAGFSVLTYVKAAQAAEGTDGGQ